MSVGSSTRHNTILLKVEAERQLREYTEVDMLPLMPLLQEC
jgi:hypothetical protein